MSDCVKYKLDILCVQETKIKNGADYKWSGFHFLLFESDSPYYGCGFVVSQKWSEFMYSAWRVSDRICVVQFKLRKTQGKANLLTIVNVYAPTSERARKEPEEIERFYKDLNNTITKLGNKTIIIIAGDFNSKIGKKQEGETCLGNYSKGTRNENGEKLIDFCEEKNFFITNSAFCHPARHITTWTGQIKDKTTDTIRTIYNQIDYILCHKRHKHLMTNARSYGGTLLTSDHKLVKTNFILESHKLWRKKRKLNNTPKINATNIVNEPECREQYRQLLDAQLTHINKKKNEGEPDVLWKNIQSAIKHSAEGSAGVIINKNTRRLPDKVIMEMSTKQKDIRLRIQNSKGEEEKCILKRERNKILHQIRERSLKIRNEELDKQVENIDISKNDQAMYKAVKTLNNKRYENPKVADSTGKLMTNPDDMMTIVSDYYKTKFNDANTQPLSSFSGQPRSLIMPITPREVRNAFNSLSNNRAPGEDDICPEFLKYGTPSLDERVADLLNYTFETHKSLNINTGILIPIQKPGKPKGPPQNLRPITLLNTIRKALSILTLNRIRPSIEAYLSPNQSGFRQDRSTADVVWTHKWLVAKTLTEKVNITITGIDMSAAFDTIDRHALLKIMEDVVMEDELRLVRFLLSETWVKTRIYGSSIENPFLSNIGTPQGDSLSPILFVVYMENALRDVRNNLPIPRTTFENTLPSEIAYADDIDFISLEQINIDEIKRTLENHQLHVNVEKTDITHLSKEENGWKKTKKVGSLIGDTEDVQRRKQLSTIALNKLKQVWIRKDKLKTATKIKLYKSLVKSVLIYNCGTWALTQNEEEKLDTFHRKQLRTLLNIHYPTKITNKSLYKKCNETPLSKQILEIRWRLFGHILRRDNNIPANKAMKSYFTQSGQNKYLGRPTTNIQTVLNRDLKRLQYHQELRSEKDLSDLQSLAKDRDQWREFINRIREAAESSQSVD